MTGKDLLAAAITLGCLWMPAGAQEGSAEDRRPAWAVDGVPDAVWMAVEAAMAATEKDRAKTLLREAETLARTAIAGYENDPGRRYALAVVLGLRADREGGKTKIGVASELRKQLDIVLGLEPEHAGAHHMLGRLNAGVLRMNRVTRWLATSLLGGEELRKATWPEAERHLVFAEARAPAVNDHHLQLAYLYRDTKRPALALVEVGHVLAMPFPSAIEKAVHDQALTLKRKLDGR